MQQPQEIDDSPAEQAVARVAAVDVAKASGEVCTRMPAIPAATARPVQHESLDGQRDHKRDPGAGRSPESMAIEKVVLETDQRLLAAVLLRARSGRAACRAGQRCRARRLKLPLLERPAA
jgi:hypothetical protein